MLRFPKVFVEKVDEYKEKKGFGTRTQTIFHLIQVALDQSDKRSLVQRRFIPHSLMGLRPSHSLKMGVFSPISDKPYD